MEENKFAASRHVKSHGESKNRSHKPSGKHTKPESSDGTTQTSLGEGDPNNSPETVNLLDALDSLTGSLSGSLEIVRLSDNEMALVPFTSEGQKVQVHYCQENEIVGYVRCNGDDCVLCRIGRKRDERLLLPVYCPISSSIMVLPISTSLRPLSLWPQVANVLKANRPMVMFIRREGGKYYVSTTSLSLDADAGEECIKAFMATENDLTSVYPTLGNEQLALVPEIQRMFSLKGGML